MRESRSQPISTPFPFPQWKRPISQLKFTISNVEMGRFRDVDSSETVEMDLDSTITDCAAEATE